MGLINPPIPGNHHAADAAVGRMNLFRAWRLFFDLTCHFTQFPFAEIIQLAGLFGVDGFRNNAELRPLFVEAHSAPAFVEPEAYAAAQLHIALALRDGIACLFQAQFKRLACRIGSAESGRRADASIVVQYAPRFPILLNFWESDDEFPCSGKAFVDANAHHYLTIEAAGGACSAVIQRLIDLKNADPPKHV
ncbi:MAG: DUF3786 domain-containing protein [Candidatus Faecivicinus sp.]